MDSSYRLPSIVKGNLSPMPLSSPAPSPTPPLSLPHLFVTTKAERYDNLIEFDRKQLQRHKSHVRNALKTTEHLDAISTNLDARLNQLDLDGDSKGRLYFDRLSAYRDAFEDIIKCSGVFSPLLQEIKDIYNDYLMLILSQQDHVSKKNKSPVTRYPQTSSSPLATSPDDDLRQLKKQLHHLEVESRVLICENSRLHEELIQEKQIYLKRKQQVSESSKTLPPPATVPNDYAALVEDLQLKIAEEHEAILKIKSETKGRVPLSVCHTLEQCVRAVEIETLKCQKRNERLHQEIKKWQTELWEHMQAHGHSAEVYGQIWNTLIIEQEQQQSMKNTPSTQDIPL